MPIKPPRRFSPFTNTLYHAGLACTLGALLFAITFPLFEEYLPGRNRAYLHVLEQHYNPHFVKHQKREHNQFVYERQPYLLYLSWFPTGDPVWARACTVSAKGATKHERIVWNNGTGGGEGESIDDPRDLETLQQLSALPSGLESPNDVAYGGLLIVTSARQGRRVTRYYDRARLPPTVNRLVQLLHLELNSRLEVNLR